MKGGFTYIKRDQLSRSSTGNSTDIAELGLALGEVARILGVELSLYQDPDATVGNWLALGIDLDPDNVGFISHAEDSLIAVLYLSTNHVGTTYGSMDAIHTYHDYSNLNILTARDVAIHMYANDAPGGAGFSAVFYKKFKPTPVEMMQLIAARR